RICRHRRRGQSRGNDAGLWAPEAGGDCSRAGNATQAVAARRTGCRSQLGRKGRADRTDRADSRRTGRIGAAYRARYRAGDENLGTHQRARPRQDDCRRDGQGDPGRPESERSLSGTGRRRGRIMSTSGNVVLKLSRREVREGPIVTLLGAKGAGKSTTLKTISGLVRASAGTVEFMGEDITRKNAHDIARTGLVHVPEGRHILRGLTVKENLELGAFTVRD